MPSSEALYLRPRDAHALTAIPAATWRKWAAEGFIRSVKAGKAVLIPREEVDRLLKEGERPRKA